MSGEYYRYTMDPGMYYTTSRPQFIGVDWTHPLKPRRSINRGKNPKIAVLDNIINNLRAFNAADVSVTIEEL